MSEEYWRSSLENITDRIGIVLTTEQLDRLAKCCESAASMQWEATGGEFIPDPRTMEVERLTAELETERRMVVCRECGGRGCVTEEFGPVGRTSTSTCSKCRGKGKHLP